MVTGTEPELQSAIITPGVAVSLHTHLREQGRSLGSIRDLETLLAKAVSRQWGTTGARRFRDSEGGGWLVDLSDYLDGEELYGMVRSSVGGSRLMTVIVDTDQVAKFESSGGWGDASRTPHGVDGEPPPDPQSLALAASAEYDRGQAARAEASKHDPMLVLVMPDQGSTPVTILRATREEIPGVVKMLLSQGVRAENVTMAVTEANIEIWSVLSKPTVEIRF